VSEWKNEASASRSTADEARAGARQVTETAREQAKTVLGEARGQTRQATARMRVRATEEANTQTRRLGESLRAWSDELASMAEGAKPDSPTRDVVHQIASSTQRAANYLDQHGVQGALDDVQAFARRRPGIFLAVAAMAGLAIARATKAASQSSQEGGPEPQAPSRADVMTTDVEGRRVYETTQPPQSELGTQGRTTEGL
jgi:hypothetical protein